MFNPKPFSALTTLCGNYVLHAPRKNKKTFNCSLTVAKYLQNTAQLLFRQFSSAQTRNFWDLSYTLLVTVSENLFRPYFSKFKFSVTRIRKKPKKPLIILEKWQNMSSSFLNSFQVRKQQIFAFSPNPFLVRLKRKLSFGLLR